jgi:hypothetical protein
MPINRASGGSQRKSGQGCNLGAQVHARTSAGRFGEQGNFTTRHVMPPRALLRESLDWPRSFFGTASVDRIMHEDLANVIHRRFTY